jgi:hypothetical protein
LLKLIRTYPLWFLVLAVLLFVYFGANIAAFYTDWLWFGEVGYRRTFVRIYGTRILLFSVFGAASFFLAYANLLLARRFSPPVGIKVPGTEAAVYDTSIARPLGRTVRVLGGLRTVLDGLLLLGALFFAVLAGTSAQAEWNSFLRFTHPVAWGQADPHFGRDIGMYVFQLPWLRFSQGWLLVVLLLVGAGVTLVYLYQQSINAASGKTRIDPHVRAHLSAIAALWLLVKAWGYYLDRFDLLYGEGLVPGAGYADIHVRLPMLNLLVGVTILTALAVGLNIWRRTLALPGIATALWLAFGGLGILIPGIVQRVAVRPNEAEREAPYLARAIAATRAAYGVEHAHVEDFPAAPTLTPADLARNQGTLANIRLWDYEPLLETFPQQQGLRQYYDFPDVDVDRYRLADGTYQQVLIAAREIAPERLDERAQTWPNTHLRYTHGFGAVASPAGRATPEGLPDYLLKDVPPIAADPALTLHEPRVYYGIGAEPGTYAVVNTRRDEFDYPAGTDSTGGADDRTNRYAGRGGIPLRPLAKLAFAARFNGWGSLLLTSDLTPQSRLLFARRVPDRVKRIAPFLYLDHDPYPVVARGRLMWIQDCYTVSSAYPYSQPSDWGDDLSAPVHLNYIRNSVKALVDAYDGSVTLFAADERDPVLRCYQRVFPGLIRPAYEMPELLRPHRRYPEDLFALQRRILADYHVTDPQVFYARADAWQLARRQGTVEGMGSASALNSTGESPDTMPPYYITLRLPGAKAEEFVLLSPFTPRERQNMIALLAARCDDPAYGDLVLYRFPASRTVFGPEQVGKRLRSDAKISPFLSLNDQKGSRVLFGSMLVVPVERSLLYVQPVYVKARNSGDTDDASANGSIPELKQVVVAFENRIAMEPTLPAALASLFGGNASGPAPIGRAGSGTPTPPGDMRNLARRAGEQYDRAQALLRAGDFAGYGRESKALGETLRQLRERVGGTVKESR